MSDFEFAYVDYTPDLVTYNSDKIKTKMYKPKHGTTEYKILNYDDSIVCDNDAELGQYRSIIVNPDDNEFLCFTPPKSMTFDGFTQLESSNDIAPASVKETPIFVNELIEGTMISLFYDPRIESWEIASKGAIGGNYWFYRTQYNISLRPSVEDVQVEQPTFRKMFLDAFRSNEGQDINDLVQLQDLSKEYCYNFILQHPSNHIVLHVIAPVLYLVSVFHLKGTVATAIPTPIYEEWDCFMGLNGLIAFPRRFDDMSYEELDSTYCSANSPHTMVGLMITNLKTGMRTCMENKTYKEVRELRGNNPNLQYQYLCLLKMGKVMDFLKYFPQYKQVFYRFYKQFQEFVTNVHQSYMSYYIKKTGDKISKKYFPIIYKLHHDIYLTSLGEGKDKIIMRRSEIGKHVGAMAPSELIYYLNYNVGE